MTFYLNNAASHFYWLLFTPFPNGQILDSAKLKEFADDNFKFNENGREFSKWLENTVRKGEIARNEQFLLFPQCFQMSCIPDTLKPGLVWERVNISLKGSFSKAFYG